MEGMLTCIQYFVPRERIQDNFDKTIPGAQCQLLCYLFFNRILSSYLSGFLPPFISTLCYCTKCQVNMVFYLLPCHIPLVQVKEIRIFPQNLRKKYKKSEISLDSLLKREDADFGPVDGLVPHCRLRNEKKPGAPGWLS